MLPLALYIRISQDRLNLHAGGDRQLVDCEAIATRKFPGTPTVVYDDNDVSAYRGKRPGFTRLCEDIRARRVGGVIGYNMDRMFRQPREFEAFLDLCAATNMQHVFTAQGDIDLSTHDGQLHARILVAVAKKASDDTSRRITRAARDRGESGRWHGGHVPFGYRLSEQGIEPDPTAAAIVLDAGKRALAGESLRAIATSLRGTPGAPVSGSGWRALLTNPVHAGLTRLHTAAQWQPIVPLDQWRELCAVLLNGTKQPHSRARNTLLSGLLICGKCGASVTGSKGTEYVCSKCFGVSVRRDWADEIVAGVCFEAVKVAHVTVHHTAHTDPSTTPAGTMELDSAAQLRSLAEDYADGLMTRDEWLTARDRVTARLAAAVAPITPVTPRVPDDLERVWDSMTLEAKRTAVRGVLRAVTVKPAAAGQSFADRFVPDYSGASVHKST